MYPLAEWIFFGDAQGFPKDEVKAYQMVRMSSLSTHKFFSSLHIYSLRYVRTLIQYGLSKHVPRSI
jgi:hypothetical protein